MIESFSFKSDKRFCKAKGAYRSGTNQVILQYIDLLLRYSAQGPFSNRIILAYTHYTPIIPLSKLGVDVQTDETLYEL